MKLAANVIKWRSFESPLDIAHGHGLQRKSIYIPEMGILITERNRELSVREIYGDVADLKGYELVRDTSVPQGLVNAAMHALEAGKELNAHNELVEGILWREGKESAKTST